MLFRNFVFIWLSLMEYYLLYQIIGLTYEKQVMKWWRVGGAVSLTLIGVFLSAGNRILSVSYTHLRRAGKHLNWRWAGAGNAWPCAGECGK